MLTVEELNALPYKGVAAPAASLTVDELNALPYGANPASQGILSSDYRDAFYGTYMGRQFLLRRPLSTGERPSYQAITTTVAGALLSEARCLVWESKRRIETQEFGWISTRDTMFSVLPEDVLMYPGWQVCLLETPEPEVAHITREGASWQAVERPLAMVTAILTAGGATVSPSTYTVSAEGIAWGSGAPAEGTRLTIEYTAAPWYRWQADEQGVLQQGADGLLLPQIGMLTKVSAQG